MLTNCSKLTFFFIFFCCSISIKAQSSQQASMSPEVRKWLSVAESENLDVFVRADAVHKLIKLGDKRCMKYLLEMLPGHYDSFASGIISAVKALDYPEALPILLIYIENNKIMKITLPGKLNAVLSRTILFCYERNQLIEENKKRLKKKQEIEKEKRRHQADKATFR